MPAEIRHIVFCAAEVAAAVREYRRHLGRPLPSGALRRLELFPGTGGVRVSLEIAPDNGLSAESWEISSAEMTDALIFYCGAHNIPMPAAGAKSLQRFGENLLLIVTVNLKGAGWPLSAGLAMHRPKIAVEAVQAAD